jgi:hypothetical protein
MVKRFLRWLFPVRCIVCDAKSTELNPSGWERRQVWMDNGFFCGWTLIWLCATCPWWPRLRGER